MENSEISWCDHTFNAWIGCTKVSPGCVHCYAATRDVRFAGGVHWGPGAPRQRTSAANWAQPLKWNRQTFVQCADCGARFSITPREENGFCACGGPQAFEVRPRVFCASLSDWLDDEVPIEWLADLLALIHATPNLDWLLLTKRPENWDTRLWSAWRAMREGSAARKMVGAWLNAHDDPRVDAPANVWVGTTVEDQARAWQRIPELLRIPAKVRFLSVEPLLETVDLRLRHVVTVAKEQDAGDMHPVQVEVSRHLHWVICGGESGAGARAMEEAWARSLRDQCASARVPFFMKQLGGSRDKRGALDDLPEDLRVREFPVSK